MSIDRTIRSVFNECKLALQYVRESSRLGFVWFRDILRYRG